MMLLDKLAHETVRDHGLVGLSSIEVLGAAASCAHSEPYAKRCVFGHRSKHTIQIVSSWKIGLVGIYFKVRRVQKEPARWRLIFSVDAACGAL